MTKIIAWCLIVGAGPNPVPVQVLDWEGDVWTVEQGLEPYRRAVSEADCSLTKPNKEIQYLKEIIEVSFENEPLTIEVKK